MSFTSPAPSLGRDEGAPSTPPKKKEQCVFSIERSMKETVLDQFDSDDEDDANEV
jgi:hypothetical protein